jgi:hypothetical protein
VKELRNDLNELRVDMQAMRNDMSERIANSKNDTLRWMAGGFIAQSALLVAILALMR